MTIHPTYRVNADFLVFHVFNSDSVVVIQQPGGDPQQRGDRDNFCFVSSMSLTRTPLRVGNPIRVLGHLATTPANTKHRADNVQTSWRLTTRYIKKQLALLVLAESNHDYVVNGRKQKLFNHSDSNCRGRDSAYERDCVLSRGYRPLPQSRNVIT